MNKAFYVFILLFISNLITAQIRFEKGFYINNDSIKIEGLIKNADWRNNPKTFEFKKTENSETENISIDYAKEFEIFGICKYIRADVDMERSSNKEQYLEKNKDPLFTNERLYLKQLVFGTSNLFKYEENGLEKFFYSVNNSPIKQLIFIKYKTAIENNYDVTIATNDLFRRQLWTDVKCETTTKQSINATNYTTSDLAKYFKSYNTCKGDQKTVEVVEKKLKHNIKVSVMYNMASMDVQDYAPNYSPDFKNSSFGFGFEYELLLPFNSNKWGIIFEPSYNNFKDEKTLPPYGLGTTPIVAKTDIKYFQLPVGVRYHFFLNSNSKLFVNPVINVRLIGDKNKVEYNLYRDLYYNNTTFSLAVGAGYIYRKFSGEVRYYPNSDLSVNSGTKFGFTNTSFILRYELFGK